MKTLKRVYLYRTSTMPEDGWFQSCLVCYTITATEHFHKIMEYKNVIYEYKVYLCPSCKKNPPLSLKYKCNQYISDNQIDPLNQNRRSPSGLPPIPPPPSRVKYAQDWVHKVETISDQLQVEIPDFQCCQQQQ